LFGFHLAKVQKIMKRNNKIGEKSGVHGKKEFKKA
jgi:hypothetical protein